MGGYRRRALLAIKRFFGSWLARILDSIDDRRDSGSAIARSSERRRAGKFARLSLPAAISASPRFRDSLYGIVTSVISSGAHIGARAARAGGLVRAVAAVADAIRDRPAVDEKGK
jgi:hypothetical protein